MIDRLTALAKGVIGNQFSLTDCAVEWSVPPDATLGDLASPVALRIAKQVGSSPKMIAQAIVDGLKGAEGVERVEIAGAGYVNVWLTAPALLGRLSEVEAAIKPGAVRSEAPVVIDYSSPNIAKPFGIHHILTTVIGQVVRNLHEHCGYTVVGVNFIGDFGTQFGKLFVALQRWGTKPIIECAVDDLLALYVKFHDEAEKEPGLEDEARSVFQKLEKGDPELTQFLLDTVKVTMQEVARAYERLHVKIEEVRGEYYYRNATEPIIAEGKKKKVFTEGEQGALIVPFAEETGLPPAIVVKGDGATVYLTRDLAALRDRIESWHPQAILYVVDVSQTLHLKQLFETSRLLKWDLPGLEHVVFGRMSFADRSMSTRKGNILKLEEVLDEAVRRADALIESHREMIQTDDRKALAEMMGVGSVVYGILSQNRKMDIVFDWDKVLTLEGNSAPYLQYTHARARSVLRKAEQEVNAMPTNIDALTPHERALIQALLQFADSIEEARRTRMPHVLANALYRLSQVFNAFYNTEPILKASEPLRSLRLSLTALTASVLKSGAALLTLRVPDRM